MDDIPDLARHLLKRMETESGSPKFLSANAIDMLKNHHWPGNVLELENFLRRVSLYHPQETIADSLVETELKNQARNSHSGNQINCDLDQLQRTVEEFIDRYMGANIDELPEEGIYQKLLPNFERPIVKAALSYTNGNQIKAAEVLGLNRNTLRKKIREQNIRIVRTSN